MELLIISLNKYKKGNIYFFKIINTIYSCLDSMEIIDLSPFKKDTLTLEG